MQLKQVAFLASQLSRTALQTHSATSKVLPSTLPITRKFVTMPEPTGDPKQHDHSKFKDGMTGSCLCGSITVKINDPDLFSKPRGHLCHCANCRKIAGSYVASNLLIETEKVEVMDRDGTLRTYEDKASLSGNSVYRKFCSVDGKYVESAWQPATARIPCVRADRLVLQSHIFRNQTLPRQNRTEDGHLPSHTATRARRLLRPQARLGRQDTGHPAMEDQVGRPRQASL